MQFELQPLAGHLDRIERGLSRCRAQVAAGVAIDVKDIALKVGDDRGGRVGLKEYAPRQFVKIGFLGFFYDRRGRFGAPVGFPRPIAGQ